MKSQTIKFKGEDYEYWYPEGLESDLKGQIAEVLVAEHYKPAIKQDGIYLDIGANIGNATRYFAPYAKQIYSLEPNQQLYEALVKNTENLPNVKTFNLALSHASGYDYMYSNRGSNIAQTFWGDGSSTQAVKVEQIALDELFEQEKIDHVDVMKIDVEGSEYVIFPSRGFAKVADKIDLIIGEAHYLAGGGFPQAVPAILKDYGFETEFIQLEKPNYHRSFEFRDFKTGDSKWWSVPENTLFIAKRK
jgi:FkbM family methyltransferase